MKKKFAFILMSDAYNGKIKGDQFLTKLQQFDKDLAAAK